MPRTIKDPDERRSELIATAQQLFYTNGYERTAVNDIVKAVGVAKGTFYYYFDSKQAILEAIVDELIGQSLALVQAIVVDERLPVLQKWRQLIGTLAAWELAHKDEMLSLVNMMQSDENLKLQRKIEAKTVQLIVPETAKIVAQGVEEGVFKTDYVLESAEIIQSIMHTASPKVIDIIIHQDRYDNPVATIQRHFAAIQTAIERVLGAPQGALPLTDPDTLAAWFSE